MLDPQHLTTLHASAACYGDSFTLYFIVDTICTNNNKAKLNSVAWVFEGTIRQIDRRLSEYLVPTFSYRGHVVSVTDPYGRNLAFLDWSRYFLFQVAPQLYSRG
jgi:hypothetical protein